MPPINLNLLAEASGRLVTELEEVAKIYPVAISDFLRQRISEGSYSLKALRQFLPDARELIDIEGFHADPTSEKSTQPVNSVIRTYDNRLALILTQRCLVYCRFCFRKDFVGFTENEVIQDDLERALAYLQSHSEVEDVLLSGGDPLAIPNARLIPFLEKLISIQHLKAIRIHSRAISVRPDRIDDELVDFLKNDDRFWYYGHMNHPDDINHPEVIAAVRRLLSARVPVLNQCVILAGVNDDAETMLKLMKLSYENKVIPYNLYVLDRVKGAAHFEVPIQKIAEIYKSLAELPGPAQPVLVYVDSKNRKQRAVFSSHIDLISFLQAREQK